LGRTSRIPSIKCRRRRYGSIKLEFVEEEFEDTKGVIRIVFQRRTDNTMTKRKRTQGQATIYKTYT
jgi:hypothetical protein